MIKLDISEGEIKMPYENKELQEAYTELTKIISEEEFNALEKRFIRSYYVDYEYKHNELTVFMKCDNSELLIEMLFFNTKEKKTEHTFAFHFTQCDAYFEWLGHFTELLFKDALFCKEKYGPVNIRHETVNLIESKMDCVGSAEEKKPYQWV